MKAERASRPGRVLLAAALLATGLGGCASDPPLPHAAEIAAGTPITLTPAETRAAALANRLGLDLLDRRIQDRPDQTAALSPLGLSLLLGMAAEGAGTDTAGRIRAALGPDTAAAATIAATLRQRADGRPHDRDGRIGSVSFDSADAVFAAPDLPLAPAFRRAVTQHFGAATTAIDFRDPATPARLAAWVAGHTGGRITAVDSTPDTRLLLIDALHFHGDWRMPFDPALTRPRPFTLADGTTVPVAMMARDLTAADHAETGDWQALTLPYAGGDFRLLLVLPKPGRKPVTATTLADLIGRDRLGKADGHLDLPRIAVATGAALTADLARVGIDLESPTAFTGMIAAPDTAPPVCDLRQRVSLDLDETGTAAAAVTELLIAGAAPSLEPPPPPFRMVLDHPFFLAVTDRITGQAVLVAWVARPQR